MSFFSEFFDMAKLEQSKNEVSCSIVFGAKICIVGRLKIDNMSDSEILLKANKKIYKIIH